MKDTLAISIGYGCVMGATSGAQSAFLANVFPAASRFTGVAIARELNGAIVAGFTPLIALALIGFADGRTWAASCSLALCCHLSLIAVLLARRRGS